MQYRFNRLATIKARGLRKASTDAELYLWKNLRSRQLEGLKFRRQEPIGHFVVDFFCLDKKLIIEVDGSQHTDSKEYDAERSEYLKNLGFTVLRFWNNEVLNNIDGVLEKIRISGNPHPRPLPRGEGSIISSFLRERISAKGVNQRLISLGLRCASGAKVRANGFSLVELIMYLAIIGSLVGVVVGMFVSFNRLRVKSESQTELSQNARSAVERLRQEIVRATGVASPTDSTPVAILQLNMLGGNLTCFQISSGILQMAEGAATCATYNPITSSKVSITNSDIFTRIDNTGAKSTIQIKLTLIYNNRPEYSYTTQTTAGLR